MAYIEPAVGRIVWFYPNGKQEDTQPLAGQIAKVLYDEEGQITGRVNLGYLDENGRNQTATDVPIIQGGEEAKEVVFAEWMPYQRLQAAAQEK